MEKGEKQMAILRPFLAIFSPTTYMIMFHKAEVQPFNEKFGF
jgi:hypothetical protein